MWADVTTPKTARSETSGCRTFETVQIQGGLGNGTDWKTKHRTSQEAWEGNFSLLFSTVIVKIQEGTL